MMIKLRTQKETQINLRTKPFWKHQVPINGFTVKKTGNVKLSMTEMRIIFLCHCLHHHPAMLEVGDKAPLEEEEEEEGAEEEIIIGLVTQMSHHFPHSPLAITHMTVQVHHTAVTTPECVALEDSHCCHKEVPPYTVALYENVALAHHMNKHRAK
jgi:hypothetical protein